MERREAQAKRIAHPAEEFPELSDYGLIGDCHTAALVSNHGSIDWCCLPRFDSDSCFGRLLDWHKGGFFSISPHTPCTVSRHYHGNSLILITTFSTPEGEARVIDLFAMRRGGRLHPRREIVRIVEGIRGSMRLDVIARPRFDFGEVKPWIYRREDGTFVAVGSNKALLFIDDVGLAIDDDHALAARIETRPGERRYVALRFASPEAANDTSFERYSRETLEQHLDETARWWGDWAARLRTPPASGPGLLRSAITLKALSYAPTGAIVAAVTTSLPERIGGERNWDYRYSWLRDSIFTLNSLAELGCASEADGLRRFIQRSAAGNADELQVMYGVDGKRRLTEVCLDKLGGWRNSRPVRIGNAAHDQFQMDMYGLVLDLTWRWSERGNTPSGHYWRFLCEIVEAARARWREPDRGIWEIRSEPRHFVHSKVMCWVALDRGMRLAQAHDLPGPVAEWKEVAAEISAAVLREGVDAQRDIFVESFGSREVDAALLLLPEVGFVAYDDPRMLRTTDVIAHDLQRDGLILRYRTEDGMRGDEGVFLACSFWMAECLARQGRIADARCYFDRAAASANDLGLFAEEYDTARAEMIGNIPQGLTHLAHIAAALALAAAEAKAGDASPKAKQPVD